MDIDLLSKMVKELILDRDEVALPGVGTFVTEIVPATFSDKGYTINPPYRRLFFRQRIDGNDTSLVDFYARTNNIDAEKARIFIEDFLLEMKAVLQQKKTIVFPGLGRLRATKENNFFFVADQDLDIYPAGFGLEAVSLKSRQESEEEVAAAVAGLKSILDGEAPLEEKEPAADEAIDIFVDEELAQPAAAPEFAGPDIPEISVSGPAVATDAEVSVLSNAEPVPESSVEPEVTIQTELEVEETAAPVTGQVSDEPVKAAAGMPGWLKVCLWILVTVVLAFIVFAVLGRLAPGLVDKILYSPEDLEVIKNL